MTYENFCYWLMGFYELQNPTEITKEQLAIIRNHLNLTMKSMEDVAGYADAPYKWTPPPPGMRC